ncbi:MAG: hypothetical protein R2932_57695 [Caldilineaceae bacterium]
MTNPHPLQSARPNGAGAVFAFIGPEATGKSTLVAATTAWLQASAKARSVHVGKPRAGWLTLAFATRCAAAAQGCTTVAQLASCAILLC